VGICPLGVPKATFREDDFTGLGLLAQRLNC
jgi:hypothetical protein